MPFFQIPSLVFTFLNVLNDLFVLISSYNRRCPLITIAKINSFFNSFFQICLQQAQGITAMNLPTRAQFKLLLRRLAAPMIMKSFQSKFNRPKFTLPKVCIKKYFREMLLRCCLPCSNKYQFRIYFL